MLGQAERHDVHQCLILLPAQDDALVVAERDAPDGLARVADLADERARLEVCGPRGRESAMLSKTLKAEGGRREEDEGQMTSG